MSDTHSFLDKRIIKYLDNCDEVWHAGDIGSKELLVELETKYKLRAVYGNIDNHEIRRMVPENLVFEVEGLKVTMTHIAGKPGKYYSQGVTALNLQKSDVFICGHSHILLVQFDKKYNTLWLNPGACGNHGFHKFVTLLMFEVSNGKISNMNVVELPR